MAAAQSAVLDRPTTDAVVIPFPKVEPVDAHPEYRYELIWKEGNIVGAIVPWLITPVGGIVKDCQRWHIVDDDKHAKPLSGELSIRFRKRTIIPTILIDERASMCLEAFLREILGGTVVYSREFKLQETLAEA